MRQVLAVLAVVMLCGVWVTAAAARPGHQVSHGRSLTVSSRVSYPTVPAAVRPTVTLIASGPDGPVGFGEVASSAETIAAPGTDLQNLIVPLGVYVFGKPATGWSAMVSPANLTAADGDRLGGVAASDTTVVAGDASQGDAGLITALVFTRPAGGWNGSEHESAKLIAPSTGSGERAGPLVAISGDTAFTSDGGSVYAFNEAPGGWSGDPPVAATLALPTPGLIDSFGVSGDTVVIRSGRWLYVFTKPSVGWSGSPRSTATLTLPGGWQPDDAVAVSGKTIVATGPVSNSMTLDSVYVAQRPATGWRTQRRAKFATLQVPADPGDQLGPTIQVSGGTTVLSTAHLQEHQCFPCTGTIYAISQPETWSGTTKLTATTTLSNVGGPPAGALSGQILAAGALDGIHLYTVSQPATITSAKLRNLGGNDPGVTIGIAQARGGHPVTGIDLTFSSSLRLKAKLIDRIKLSGGVKAHFQAKRNMLLVKIARPATQLTITIGNGVLAKSPALAARVAMLSQSPRRSKKSIQLELVARIRGGDQGTTTGRIAFKAS